MKVNVKMKKLQEVEINEEKEIDIEKMIEVLNKRIEFSNKNNSDSIIINNEFAEDIVLILKDTKEKEETLDKFKKSVPSEILNDLNKMASFLAISGIEL